MILRLVLGNLNNFSQRIFLYSYYETINLYGSIPPPRYTSPLKFNQDAPNCPLSDIISVSFFPIKIQSLPWSVDQLQDTPSLPEPPTVGQTLQPQDRRNLLSEIQTHSHLHTGFLWGPRLQNPGTRTTEIHSNWWPLTCCTFEPLPGSVGDLDSAGRVDFLQKLTNNVKTRSVKVNDKCFAVYHREKSDN